MRKNFSIDVYKRQVLDKVPVVSVAVCDTPAGKYEFYGYVHYEDGTRLGVKEGDEPQFDPGVLDVYKRQVTNLASPLVYSMCRARLCVRLHFLIDCFFS